MLYIYYKLPSVAYQCGLLSKEDLQGRLIEQRERERERERERDVLFNDALNTFYLRLYGVRHMVKDHSDSEKGNPLPPHRLLFSTNSKGSFICTSHRQDNTHHGLCYTSRGTLAGARNSSMGPPHEGSIRRPTVPWANALPLSYVPLTASRDHKENVLCVIQTILKTNFTLF